MQNTILRKATDEATGTHFPQFLQLPTHQLLDEFGAGHHKPGSGSAAALLGLVACKMMQTVITVTLRNEKYAANFSQLTFVNSIIRERHEPFFRESVQKDSAQFDRCHKARLARRACVDAAEKRRLSDKVREELIPATELPLQIAEHALDAAERGMLVYDLGARHVRGDSGVAVSSALSACSGSLFIVYLNLLEFREGRWASSTRLLADGIAERFNLLQFEQFRRVSRIQNEGVTREIQPELGLALEAPEDEINY